MSKNVCVLVINCGSSSLKYEVFRFPEQKSIGRGVVERIGSSESVITHRALEHHKIFEDNCQIKNHKEAFKLIASCLVHEDYNIIDTPTDLAAIGHRVVHGGEIYSESTIINEKVIQDIDTLSDLAPLHNPAHLEGIRAAQENFPHCTQVAVFDTAFHQTIPARAYMYPLPYIIYKEYGIRRYGFHGTSHQYVSKEAAKMLEKKVEDINLITCHLGNGSSIAAIRRGKSIDTSMGFTPLAGLMMGTRSGDLDPAIFGYLINKGRTVAEIDTILNKKSGLLGISGISNDMRDLEAAENDDNRAVLALEMYAHNVRKYIGAYVAELMKVDMLVFTAGIGEHDSSMRYRICKSLQGVGMLIDEHKNKDYKKHSNIISKDDSPVKISVIPTNEELQIAIDTFKLTS